MSAGRADGDAEQFGIDGSLKPHDAGIGQLDLQLPDGAGIEDRDRQEGMSRGTVGPCLGRAGDLSAWSGEAGGAARNRRFQA